MSNAQRTPRSATLRVSRMDAYIMLSAVTERRERMERDGIRDAISAAEVVELSHLEGKLQDYIARNGWL